MYKISIATATFYNMEFERALEVIKKAGFDYVELGIYWKGGECWEMAQHLKNIKPIQVLNMIKNSGLEIASIHDTGGVLENENEAFISNDIYEYLSLGPNIDCVVLHTPHKKTYDNSWWIRYKDKVRNQLLSINKMICIENMTNYDGYQVPLLDLYEMKEFLFENNCYLNMDVNHYAQCGIDISEAGNILKKYIRSIHLSDYLHNQKHIFHGEGILDFGHFFSKIDLNDLYAITSECDIEHINSDYSEITKRTKVAKKYIENLVNAIA